MLMLFAAIDETANRFVELQDKLGPNKTWQLIALIGVVSVFLLSLAIARRMIFGKEKDGVIGVVAQGPTVVNHIHVATGQVPSAGIPLEVISPAIVEKPADPLPDLEPTVTNIPEAPPKVIGIPTDLTEGEVEVFVRVNGIKRQAYSFAGSDWLEINPGEQYQVVVSATNLYSGSSAQRTPAVRKLVGLFFDGQSAVNDKLLLRKKEDGTFPDECQVGYILTQQTPIVIFDGKLQMIDDGSISGKPQFKKGPFVACAPEQASAIEVGKGSAIGTLVVMLYDEDIATAPDEIFTGERLKSSRVEIGRPNRWGQAATPSYDQGGNDESQYRGGRLRGRPESLSVQPTRGISHRSSDSPVDTGADVGTRVGEMRDTNVNIVRDFAPKPQPTRVFVLQYRTGASLRNAGIIPERPPVKVADPFA